MNDSNIKARALELIAKYKVAKPPVPVNDIAKKLSLEVIAYNFGDGASGILVIENNKGTIGYNPNEPEVRQRFTIAHEIGHFLLHHKRDDENVFVDRDFLVKKYRNASSYNGGEFKQEQEANTFASELLMPQFLLINELKKDTYKNLSEVDLINELSKVFNVSSIAMTYRLSNLNY